MSRKRFEELTESERAEYASKVKALRQTRGMTQDEVAKAAGVSRPTVVTLESGTTTPQAGKLAKVLRVLGVDVDAPEFGEQTEIWLSMIGTLIEAIPEERRQPSVNSAIRVLGDGIKPSRSHLSVVPTTETEDFGDAHLDSTEEVKAAQELANAAKHGKRKTQQAPHAE